MRGDERPELKAHPRLRARGGDDAEEQAVGHKHVNRADAAGDPQRERPKRDDEVVGHDRGRYERLDRDD